MSSRRHFLQTSGLLGALLLTGACNRRSSSTQVLQRPFTPPLSVAFLYLSAVGDYGWTFSHEQGRQAMQATLGDQVVSHIVENVPENGDTAAKVLRVLADDQHHVIFTTSFGFMDATALVAPDYPDVAFLHCSGYKRGPNVGTYLPRFEQPRFLTGMVAGAMTRSNRIGYVAAFPIPEVIRGINAFTLGVRSVNPSAQVEVAWAKTWYDPAIERQVAQTLANQGADILTQHTDSVAAVQLAQELGLYAIGYHSDMRAFGPDAHLTASLHQWGNYYTETVQSVLQGRWQSQDVWQGFATGMVDIAPLHPAVPESVRAAVAATQEDFRTQRRNPFAGVIRDQGGTMRVSEGEILVDADQLTMDWFVQGVIGSPLA